MGSLYRERMRCGTILNEKLMRFPNGSFPDPHMELLWNTGPRLLLGRGCCWWSGVSGAHTGAAFRSSRTLKAAAMGLGMCPALVSNLFSAAPRGPARHQPPADRQFWPGLCSLPSQMHTYYNAAIQGKRNRRKEVIQFLIMLCLLSFRANSAHTKVALHIIRNIYLKKAPDAWFH